MYVLMFSKEQGAFHISTVEEMCATNMRMLFKKQIMSGYVPIYCGHTYEDCSAVSEQIWNKVEKLAKDAAYQG